MALVSLRKLLKDGVEKRCAIGAYDTTNHLFAEAMIEAAEERGLPIIVMVPEFLFNSPTIKNFCEYLVNRMKNSPVDLCLHLDHAEKYENCVKAIQWGFTSVMIDGSMKSYEDNVAITKEVVKVAHAAGVDVEAEIGHVGQNDVSIEKGLKGNKEDHYTKVEDAVDFVAKTGCDALAVAFGTAHGIYKEEPKLDLERLEAIRQAVDIPLVMHGGSGLTDEQFLGAVAHGTNKINYFTTMSVAAADAARQVLDDAAAAGKVVTCSAIDRVIKKTVKETVLHYFDIFGTNRI